MCNYSCLEDMIEDILMLKYIRNEAELKVFIAYIFNIDMF